MDEHLLNILGESNKTIHKLQLLSNFFEADVVYKIYLRTQVIHNLFQRNLELDPSKLELFHLQFTGSVIDLLKKIKKNNEKNVQLIYDEIQLNNDLLTKLNESVYTEKNFELDKQRQSLKVNNSLRLLFQVLSDNTPDFPFVKNINSFSSKYSKDFYYDISTSIFEQLIHYNTTNVYTNTYAVIERKLMGQLCKYDFKTEFFCGLKSGNVILELYKFLNQPRYFLFAPSQGLFLLCDLSQIEGIDWTNTLSKRSNITKEILYNNDRLRSNASTLKTYIPPEIFRLLEDCYEKISDVNFLDDIGSVDVQANILKTMLRTDIM